MTKPERDQETKRDQLDVEQARVRVACLVLSCVAGVVAVVSLGFGLWLWAFGAALFALGSSAWAVRMYAEAAAHRAQVTAQLMAARRASFDDPYETTGSD